MDSALTIRKHVYAGGYFQNLQRFKGRFQNILYCYGRSFIGTKTRYVWPV